MRRSWSAVSFGGGIVPSILRAERFAQDASVERLGGGELEQPRQGRRDVPGTDPPGIYAASDPRAPQNERDKRVQLPPPPRHRDEARRRTPDRGRLSRRRDAPTRS